jgi:uncharacterized RDD family membrane protein YckC
VRYAGFWRRYTAKCIDTLILSVPLLLIESVFKTVDVDYDSAAYWRGLILTTAAWWLYEATLLSSSRRATLGKQYMGVRVLDGDSLSGIGFARASSRYLASIGSAMFLVGYLIQPFTKRRQALHDRIANTVVTVDNENKGRIAIIALGVGPIVMGVLGIVAVMVALRIV